MTNKEKAIELITGLIKQTRSLCVEHNLPSPEEFLSRLQKEASMVFLAEDQSFPRYLAPCDCQGCKCHGKERAYLWQKGFRRVVLE